MKQSIYDSPLFFERYLKLRENPISLNEVVEKPTMFSLLPELRGKRVLDLGCGAGGHLRHYWQCGAVQLVGLDLSSAMLMQAQQDLAKNGVDQTACRFYCLPMERLAEIEETDFDLITSSFAFHYVEDFSALLRHIHAKLKPKGELIFSQEHPIVTAHREGDRWEKDAHKQQTAYRLNHYREEGLRERNWFRQSFQTYHRTMATIINQLIQAGFRIVQVEEPMLADQPNWHAEFKDLRHRPPLLFIKSVKN
ncbi:hypothetical protein RO21_01565 [[Actinobacillus] muris]|uniref:Methyltransferase domain-containing protein n=1 Tax=Muribacter muris TaxID=67855 RepID=A0A0J5S619_9PAST|nr:class I SAM-dependent methyltransferase [Muribacter muris]KMK52302.1 hypothetical protein RO21_01565 [[Actinobacillus] muris] [Muribacter muris]